ncbi:MAG: ABC transporter ATP-binding protein [Planctomycetes bacterium]|nr:ABC transporter ATP-binding protein [Planctomycetota bacterium]
MTECILKIENVTKAFKAIRMPKIQALDNICLNVPRNTIIGIVGSNRAGKSTLLKLALGLIKPDSGSITRFSKPVSDRSTLKHIGAVLESPVFPSHLTPTSILNILGSLSGIASEDLPRMIIEALTKVGLEDRLEQSVGGFSRGMTQRLLIAQAILATPTLLILDEPLEGLDFDARHKVRNLLTHWRQEGRSVIIVSHELEEIESLCDRIILLVNGKIIRDEPIENWRGNSEGPFLQKAMQLASANTTPLG